MSPKVWKDDTWKPGVLGRRGVLNFLPYRCTSSRRSLALVERQSHEEVGSVRLLVFRL